MTRWETDGDTGYGDLPGIRIRDEATGYIVAVAIDDIPELDAEANARLIAAAPDLLASVIELLAPLERASAEMVAHGKALDEAGEAAFDRARAAIAKAKGEAA